MNWEDECYLLSKRKFRENANIINVFSQSKGKVSGVVYGGNSRKIRNYLQISNKLFIIHNSKNENKFSHISKCKNKYVYQLQAGNVLSPKTNKFLNNKKNLDYIMSKDIYLPSRIKLFNKNPLFEGFINNNKNIKFINKNFSMHLQDVRDELVSRVGRFKNRPLKSIISVGNFLFLKEDFMKFCDFKIKTIIHKIS